MNAAKRFILTAMLGGLGVLLPITLFAFLARWVYGLITDLIDPLSNVAQKRGVQLEWTADIFVVVLLIALCFFVGLVVRTKLGGFVWHVIDHRLLLKFPGYGIIKDTIHQFVGAKQSPFSQVALVDIFGSDVRVTGFVTDSSHPELTTVFVPTGPNPTSGNICHVPKAKVELLDVPVERAMRSIISCGAGSAEIVTQKIKQSDDRE